MSTRSQIGIYESDEDVKDNKGILENHEVLLYRHSDGYPGSVKKKDDIGVVPDILPFIREFKEKRGNDVEYLGACLMAYLKYWHCGSPFVDKSDTYYDSERNVIVNGFEINPLSHGICKHFHGDIEFYYAITPTRLIVYEVSGGWGGKEYEFKKLEEHDLKKPEKVV